MERALADVLRRLPKRTAAAISALPQDELSQITEIRLRALMPLCVTLETSNRFVCDALTRQTVVISPEELEEALRRLTDYSLCRYEQDVTDGFFTLPLGARVGVCAQYTKSGKADLTAISSLNIRIPRVIDGCADELCSLAFSSGVCSLLLCGAPRSGKTTMLRDAALKLSSEPYCLQTLVADERAEVMGMIEADASRRCRIDVISSLDKCKALQIGVRSMSPQLIICDEIGSADDCEALREASAKGIKLIASAHCTDIRALERSEALYSLVRSGAFGKIAFLSGDRPGNIKNIVKVEV